MPQHTPHRNPANEPQSTAKLPARSVYYTPEVGGSLGIEVRKSHFNDRYEVSFRNSKIPSSFTEDSGFLGLGGKVRFEAVGIVSIAGNKINNNDPKAIAQALSILKANGTFDIEIRYKNEHGDFKNRTHKIRVGHEVGYLGAMITGASREELDQAKFTGASESLSRSKNIPSFIKVNSVTNNSPAHVAGLKKGDVIVSYRLDSSQTTISTSRPTWRNVSTADTFSTFLSNRSEGDQVSLLVRREVNGKIQEQVLKVGMGGYASRVSRFTAGEKDAVTSYKF